MLLNSGTPSLVSYTRSLLRDPSTAARPRFDTDADIVPFLNVRYLELREKARLAGESAALKITYLTPTADSPFVARPADFLKLRDAELELDGGDLSALDPEDANLRLLKPRDFTPTYQDWQTGGLTEPTYRAMQDQNIAIFAPPSTVGSNCLRVLYDASSAELSADEDEPLILRPYHSLICRLTAIDLLATINQENRVLMAIASSQEATFLQAITEEDWDPDAAAPVAGLDDQESWLQAHGFVEDA